MIATMMLMMVGSMPAGIELSVDPNTSRIDVEICVQDECDSDTSPLSGFMEIDLDCLADPSEISLRDFDVQADETLNFHLDYRLLGDIFITAEGLALYHAEPGEQPFVPIEGGEFTFLDVPYLKRGTVEHEARGVICAILRGLGVPCEGRRDLAEDPPTTADTLSGTIEIVEGVVRVGARMVFDEPFDPENPDLGRIKGIVVLNAAGPLPNAADLDWDDDVDLADFAALQLCLGGPGNPPADACPEGVSADLDCDGDVDLDDYAILHAELTGP